MKILYIHQHFVVRSGTSGGRSHEFSRVLVDRGHEVTIVTGAYDRSGLEGRGAGLVERMRIDGIEVVSIRVPYSQNMGMLRRMLAFLQFVVLSSWVAARSGRPDLVFATSTPLTVCIPGILASMRWRRPFVFEVRDLWPAVPIEMGVLRNPLARWAAKRLERIAYRRAEKVVALSPGMKEGIVAAGVLPGKVAVIPNASDVELFRENEPAGIRFRAAHPELGARPVVAYVGAFGRVNGLEYMLSLAREVAAIDPSVAFLLVGQGSEEARLKAMSEEMGLSGRSVFILPAVPRQELASVLGAATVLSSVFLPLPAMEANSANKFFDAFAAGKPVIVNYRGWHADLLRETGAGLALPPDDIPAAARRLVEALGDETWLERAASASRRLGDVEFNRRNLALALEAVFEDVHAC